MWMLRFNNGVTSAGFVLDSHKHPLDATVTIQDEWEQWLERSATRMPNGSSRKSLASWLPLIKWGCLIVRLLTCTGTRSLRSERRFESRSR